MNSNINKSQAVRLAAMTKTAFLERHRRVAPLITGFEAADTSAESRTFAGELLAEIQFADRRYHQRVEQALDADDERGD